MEGKLTKQDLLDMLKAMQLNIENLPPHALILPVNHYDFCALIILLHTILSYDSIPRDQSEP